MFGNGNDDHRPKDDGDETGYDRIATVVGNAAVNTDSFKWHLDMDPQSLHPTAPFAERFGSYVNRSVARPFFVSALVYLNGPEPWTPEKDAETLVLDPGTGTGVFIRPAPGRMLLMDQDATHRVSPPSRSVDVPRYSAVFKLCFYPKDPETRPSLTREEWGAPIRFGTAGGRRAGAEMLGGGEESEEEYVS
jgi:probable phosphoglycerate mutase